MAARTSVDRHGNDRKVPLPHRVMWNLPDLAAMCGRSEAYVMKRLERDPGGQTAVLHLPGGVDVPAARDHLNGDWIVYRSDWEFAVERDARTRQATEPDLADGVAPGGAR